MSRRVQIIRSQEPGEVVNRLNEMLEKGWKIQDYTVLSTTLRSNTSEVKVGVLVPEWCITVYKENNL